MELQKFIKLLETKMQQIHPESNYISISLEIKSGSRDKTDFRVFAYASSTINVEGSNSFAFHQPNIAECIAEMDRRMLEYKKTEKLDLP